MEVLAEVEAVFLTRIGPEVGAKALDIELGDSAKGIVP